MVDHQICSGLEYHFQFASSILHHMLSVFVQDEEAILSKLEASSVAANSGSEAVSVRLNIM